MVAAHRLLVVDDDADIREFLRLLLERAGYEVELASDGQAALDSFHRRPADLVLLDVSLPGLDGFETLERLRDLGEVSVILLTASSSEIEKVRGFQLGADDLVLKPFGSRELLARIEALLRRAPGATLADRYDDGALSVDIAARFVVHQGLPVRLTALEFRLLAALVRRAGEVVEVEELLQHGWGTSAGVNPAGVKLYVSYLRKKGIPIESVRGFGYRYAPPA